MRISALLFPVFMFLHSHALPPFHLRERGDTDQLCAQTGERLHSKEQLSLFTVVSLQDMNLYGFQNLNYDLNNAVLTLYTNNFIVFS